MREHLEFEEARALLLRAVTPVGAEEAALERCPGRVLAEDVSANRSVPPFDSSPYDGYAFRAADVAGACADRPVTLRVLEELPAGSTAEHTVTAGTAMRLMTGAPIPPGADTVIMYEKTVFTDSTVTLSAPARAGDNIIRRGEDVSAGALLASAGTRIDPGTLGTLASQGYARLPVCRVPRVGIISTGSELTEPGEEAGPGKIYNSNRYTFTALLAGMGLEPVYLGWARDETAAIAALIRKGADTCDAVILTGGVSVGDYDLTPAAMEACGADFLFRHVKLKPGMACAYALLEGKLLCGLSGNPASSVTNFHAVAAPALRKLAGLGDCLPKEISATLTEGFRKPSPTTRLLRGTLDLREGETLMRPASRQGNVVLSSTIGCDAMAIIPGGSGPLAPGTKLKGFLL